jgi:hypothetical protein
MAGSLKIKTGFGCSAILFAEWSFAPHFKASLPEEPNQRLD